MCLPFQNFPKSLLLQLPTEIPMGFMLADKHTCHEEGAAVGHGPCLYLCHELFPFLCLYSEENVILLVATSYFSPFLVLSFLCLFPYPFLSQYLWPYFLAGGHLPHEFGYMNVKQRILKDKLSSDSTYTSEFTNTHSFYGTIFNDNKILS
jgi:hypothetical protein